jgi:DNA mismatch endonuclease (patch repair protein)
MSAIKSKNTAPEVALGRAMWKLGLRYRKHHKAIGKPDYIFIKKKIAVFCDGDFWHGNNWKIRGMKSFEDELSRYSTFWRTKIIRNVERDMVINEKLTKEGWLVMRFWESDIKKSPKGCADKILKAYKSRQRV